jgi:acid stress-induced BolA-like protein IbaG/YrbA
MLPDEIQKKIETGLKGSEAQVRDLTGTADHYQVIVISPLFEGKSMIEQHRMVKGVFEKDIASGEVHALSLKTFTPAEWSKKNTNL